MAVKQPLAAFRGRYWVRNFALNEEQTVSYTQELTRYHRAASAYGVSYEDAETLRRAAMVLHRWSEHECNGVIQRAEIGMTDHHGKPLKEGAPYAVGNINGPGPLRYWRTPDREAGALKRAEAVAAKLGAELEYQGDPRGWPLTLKLAAANGEQFRRELCPPCR